MCVRHAERDSGGYGSVGGPVGGPECHSDYDGLQVQCDQAMHQLQLLRHKHSDTIRRFVLVSFKPSNASSVCAIKLDLFRKAILILALIRAFNRVISNAGVNIL